MTEPKPVKAREWWLCWVPRCTFLHMDRSVQWLDHEVLVAADFQKTKGDIRVREVLPDDPGTVIMASLSAHNDALIKENHKLEEQRDKALSERDQLRAEAATMRANFNALDELKQELVSTVEKLRAEVADLKRQLAEAAQERDAALIGLGRRQIGKKVTARAADGGVIAECGRLPQSVFDGAPEWVNWAHIAGPSGVVIWTELECRPKIAGWLHPTEGEAASSKIEIKGVSWQFSQTRRHRP